MGQRAFAFLDAMAKSLVFGLPIEAAVSYDRRTARLTVNLRSLPDPSGGRVTLVREWSPTVSDYADLDRFVRDRVSEFIALIEPAVPETRCDENRNRHPGISGDFSGLPPYPYDGET
jgi:hypothetical protein